MPLSSPWLVPNPLDRCKDLLKIRPYTGSLAKDVFYLLLMSALHHTLLPSVVGRYQLVDILTPWIVVTLVAAPLGKGAFLAMLGAFLIETRTTAPSGMYLTGYWMIGIGIYLSKASLSWRHYFPWIVTLTVAQLWIILFELFVNAVILNNFVFTLQQFLIQSSRLGFAVGFGMILCQRFRTDEAPMGSN